MKEVIEKIYADLGEGYGFNGSKEDAISKIEADILPLLDKAFAAGRSQISWEQFMYEL